MQLFLIAAAVLLVALGLVFFMGKKQKEKAMIQKPSQQPMRQPQQPQSSTPPQNPPQNPGQ